MKKFELVLILIAALIKSNNIISMDDSDDEWNESPYNWTNQTYGGYIASHHRIDDKKISECEICCTTNPQYIKLHCGHKACKDCLKETLETAWRDNNLSHLRCSNISCQEDFTEEDYSKMNSFAQNKIKKIKDKIADNKAPIKLYQGSLRNSLWIYFFTQTCPGCKSPTLKIEGCNHMKCKRCPAQFCWLCEVPDTAIMVTFVQQVISAK